MSKEWKRTIATAAVFTAACLLAFARWWFGLY